MGRADMHQASACFGFLLGGLLLACSSSSPSEGDPSLDPHRPAPAGPVDPTKDGSTQIVVGVDAEEFSSLGMNVGVLEIVTKIDGAEAHEILDAEKGPLFPHELRLFAPKNKLDEAIEIEVITRLRGDSTSPPMVARKARTRFTKGITKLAYVLLEVRCNQVPLGGGSAPNGPTCDAPTTCIGGACVTSDLPPLSDYYAGWATNPPSACGTGTPELTVAQGEKALQPLPDGATVTLEEGPQCGHHMWLSLRMKNLAQSGTVTTLSASQPSSGISVPATAYPYAWAASSGGACDLVGLRFQLDTGAARAADFLGKPLDIKVEATDKAGHTATSLRHVQVAPQMTVIPGRNCGAGGNG